MHKGRQTKRQSCSSPVRYVLHSQTVFLSPWLLCCLTVHFLSVYLPVCHPSGLLLSFSSVCFLSVNVAIQFPNMSCMIYIIYPIWLQHVSDDKQQKQTFSWLHAHVHKLISHRTKCSRVRYNWTYHRTLRDHEMPLYILCGLSKVFSTFQDYLQ